MGSLPNRRTLLGPGHPRGLDDEGVALPAAAHLSQPLRDGRAHPRSPVQRDDPRVVNHLHMDHDVVRCLEDEVVVVVAGRQHRRSHRPQHAAVVEIQVRPDVGGPARPPRLGAGVLAPLGFGRQRRDAAIGWVDDKGRPSGRRRAPVEPEVVVEAGRPAFAPVHAFRYLGSPSGAAEQLFVAVDGLSFEIGRLLLSQELLSRERGGPLEGRDGLVRVGALQVGVAPGGAGWRLSGGRERGQRGDGDDGQRRDKTSTAHKAIPRFVTVRP